MLLKRTMIVSVNEKAVTVINVSYTYVNDLKNITVQKTFSFDCFSRFLNTCRWNNVDEINIDVKMLLENKQLIE